MKKHFNRTIMFLLVLALLAAPLPAARAEEWVVEEDTAEEIIVEEELDDQDDIPYEEENETLIEEEYLFEEAEESFDEVPDTVETRENRAPENTPESTRIPFEGQTLDEGVYLYAEVNGNGNLDFHLLLPENAGSGEYRVTILDGKSSSATMENESGKQVMDVLTDVRPDQLLYSMALTLQHGETMQTVTIRDYLALCCANTGVSAPEKKALCVGAVSGVSDWRAGLDLSHGDTAVLLCFRAGTVEGLRISCPGHTVTEPVPANKGVWTVRITGIRACELPADLIITAEKNGQTAMLSYSPFCYAAEHWYEDTPFILLCRALAAATMNEPTDHTRATDALG